MVIFEHLTGFSTHLQGNNHGHTLKPRPLPHARPVVAA